MTKMYSLAIAGALLATIVNLVTAASIEGSTVVTTYPSGFEMRQLPRNWICCTPLKNVKGKNASEKVLQAFASGENDQKKTLTLSPAYIAAFFVAGSGEFCRYIEEASTGTVVTSTNVKMMKGTILNFYAKKNKVNKFSGVLGTYEDLKKDVKKEGGEPMAQAWFKMVIVEGTPTGEVYVGAPIRPY